jgi:hypothetical protein
MVFAPMLWPIMELICVGKIPSSMDIRIPFDYNIK